MEPGGDRRILELMNAMLVSCDCGATFERTEEISESRETGCFNCPGCGSQVASWTSRRHPEYQLAAARTPALRSSAARPEWETKKAVSSRAEAELTL
jgi:hypothetical protein